MGQLDKCRMDNLQKLKLKWEMACAEYEAAWSSVVESELDTVEHHGGPEDALAELMSIKREIDSLITEIGQPNRVASENPFVVGIITLPGGQFAA